jgi:hypothetical protein
MTKILIIASDGTYQQVLGLSVEESLYYYYNYQARQQWRHALVQVDLAEMHLLVDVKSLAEAHAVILTNCYSLRDVSPLSRVQHINLSGCRQITEVSMLSEARSLDLSHTSVRDVSKLGRVGRLNLSHTPVIDVSMLGGVMALNLSHCRGVEDVSRLTGVRELNLTGCDNICYPVMKYGAQRELSAGEEAWLARQNQLMEEEMEHRIWNWQYSQETELSEQLERCRLVVDDMQE